MRTPEPLETRPATELSRIRAERDAQATVLMTLLRSVIALEGEVARLNRVSACFEEIGGIHDQWTDGELPPVDALTAIGEQVGVR